jgi:hypothetical protein
VFRLAGTVHGKSGNVVEIIGGDRAIWNFDDLAAEVLPFSRDYAAELRDLRIQKAKKKRSKASTNPSEGQRGNLEGYYDLRTLAERRIGDLQTLRYERYPSGKMADHRDRWLLLMSVEMSHITHPAVLEDEIRKLSREIGYPEQTAHSNMAQVIERAYRAARGEKVEWMGRKVDSRYGYKNETIIQLLEITEEEQKSMKTLFGPAEKRRRDRERKRQQRRSEGVRDRSATAQARRIEVGRRTAAGESVAKIAEAVGVSKDRVKQIRRELKREGVPSVHQDAEPGVSKSVNRGV